MFLSKRINFTMIIPSIVRVIDIIDGEILNRYKIQVERFGRREQTPWEI